MIRIEQWHGVASYASPYKLPPGGAVSQTNMCCLLPGQIQCRGGMEEAMDVGHICQEMWGFTTGPDTDKIFIFTETGEILIEDAPNI